ncbi:MAG: hypothetical protein H7196_00530 [candidate division SR1 bacterium]|nr:hypothetical protein [candidate division SR1 bacterium]
MDSLPSLDKCIALSVAHLYKEKIYRTFFFRIGINIFIRHREQRLLKLLGPFFVATQIYKVLQKLEEIRTLPPLIVKQEIIQFLEKQIICYCNQMKSLDPKFFASEDYNIAIYIVASKVYNLSLAIYKRQV